MNATTFKLALLLLGMASTQIACQNSEKSDTESANSTAESAKIVLPHDSPSPPPVTRTTAQIPNELVCMVNNAYMGIKQIPVKVGDKIYYGCCEMCEGKLKSGEEHRYAIDPYSDNQVDKSLAYIVLKSEDSHEVSYFENEGNYLAFKNQN
jgi:hypothetical protein